MLKITMASEAEPCTLKLEGKLSGPWVDELERCWKDASKHAPVGQLAVDLSGVTYISSEGKKLLSSMLLQGVDLRSGSLLTRFLLGQVKNEAMDERETSPLTGNGGPR